MEEGLALCEGAMSEPMTKTRATKIERMFVILWKSRGASFLLPMSCFAIGPLGPEVRSEIQPSQPQEQ